VRVSYSSWVYYKLLDIILLIAMDVPAVIVTLAETPSNSTPLSIDMLKELVTVVWLSVVEEVVVPTCTCLSRGPLIDPTNSQEPMIANVALLYTFILAIASFQPEIGVEEVKSIWAGPAIVMESPLNYDPLHTLTVRPLGIVIELAAPS
jgi:hypothetical protein